MLNDYKKLNDDFNLNRVDITELNHFIPVWIKEHAAYFYVNKINGWSGIESVAVELIKLP
jgi:adenylyl- and sulfurtransferase ThiI